MPNRCFPRCNVLHLRGRLWLWLASWLRLRVCLGDFAAVSPAGDTGGKGGQPGLWLGGLCLRANVTFLTQNRELHQESGR